MRTNKKPKDEFIKSTETRTRLRDRNPRKEFIEARQKMSYDKPLEWEDMESNDRSEFDGRAHQPSPKRHQPDTRAVPLRRTGSGIAYPYTEAETAIALRENRGNISATARYLGCGRQTLYLKIQASLALQEVLDECRETLLDDLEGKMFEKALDGDTIPLIFTLKTQGKKRGWIESPTVQINQQFVNEQERKAEEDAAYLKEVFAALDQLEEGSPIEGEVIEE